MARIIGHRLAEGLRQPVIVDNRPGANGIIGTDLVARSAPDGYTLLIVAVGHALNPSMEKKLPYDTLRDFAGIGLTGSTPIVLVAAAGLPVDSIKSLIAYAKARPGKIDYGTSGVGSSPHLAGALFAMMAGIKLTHVPYKGTAQAITDVMAGHIQAAMVGLSGVLPHIHSGKLKALGITGAQRSALAPELPTIAEGGVPGYQANIWNGLLVPAATPKPLIGQINRELVRQLKLPETRERYAGVGADPLVSSPEEFDAFVRSEITKWEKVVKSGALEAN
jgi:tripartite-type tricarboxylate transporter receptor subunit TctC